ncbi:hypothetical protein D8674_012047 [Pyrus ussuriensis x Pyrus communis]|uniref:Uncharacterized protein n=1 Tax=Pyrus ussuriensis x Pyrus communis TaxID=2448454 RepID=A0A5N5G0E8_9ROSA|nr:hypothetical protein D8674_012047 [Pyrus ussuriensis x Pyrus communis]
MNKTLRVVVAGHPMVDMDKDTVNGIGFFGFAPGALGFGKVQPQAAGLVDHDLVLRYVGDLVRGQTQILCTVTLFSAGSSLSHSRRTVTESTMASTTSAEGSRVKGFRHGISPANPSSSKVNGEMEVRELVAVDAMLDYVKPMPNPRHDKGKSGGGN